MKGRRFVLSKDHGVELTSSRMVRMTHHVRN